MKPKPMQAKMRSMPEQKEREDRGRSQATITTIITTIAEMKRKGLGYTEHTGREQMRSCVKGMKRSEIGELQERLSTIAAHHRREADTNTAWRAIPPFYLNLSPIFLVKGTVLLYLTRRLVTSTDVDSRSKSVPAPPSPHRPRTKRNLSDPVLAAPRHELRVPECDDIARQHVPEKHKSERKKDNHTSILAGMFGAPAAKVKEPAPVKVVKL